MFVNLKCGHAINAADIAEIRYSEWKKRPCEVTLRDGSRVEGPINLVHQLGQIIPAFPGVELVNLLLPTAAEVKEESIDACTYDLRDALWREPVIGWRVDVYGLVNAIIENGRPEDYSGFTGTLYPSGRVTVFDQRTHDSLDQWIDDCRIKWLQSLGTDFQNRP